MAVMVRGWEGQFQCGHPKSPENTDEFTTKGVKKTRCRECHSNSSRNKTAITKAYKLLGITEAEVVSAPRATPFLRRVGGVDFSIEVLFASPAPEARAFVKQYERDDISKSARALLPFEAYCLAAKVCPSRMTEIVVGAIAKQRVLEGAVISALAHPTIMRQNVAQATFPEGVKDRMAHLKMVGAMPIPKSSQTVVNVNASATAQAAAKADTANLPPAEDTIRRMVEARQRAALPSQQPQLPPAVVEPQPFERREPVDQDYVEAQE